MRKTIKRIRHPIAAWLVLLPLLASEHHGLVKFSGLPVPGATVTAVQGEKKLAAITDDQGAYSFPNLDDGVWNMEVEMLCFSPLKQEVTVAANAPAMDWELKLQPLDVIKAAAGPIQAAPAKPAPAPQTAGLPPRSPDRDKKVAAALAPSNAKKAFQRTDLAASKAA